MNIKYEKLLMLLYSLLLFFFFGNIYAVIRFNQIKNNSYRSHDKFANPVKVRYAKNLNSQGIHLYGDLCAIEGSYDKCSFSNGEREYQFLTDRYGFKTTANINDSNLIIIGDSFLAASGGDNMNEQFGSVIGNLISKEVYEAAYPGDIIHYNQRHLFFKKIKPDTKFLYLLFEGNDFVTSELHKKTKQYSFLRKYYLNVKNEFIRRIPLNRLIYTKYKAMESERKIGRKDNLVYLQKLDSGRTQAFYKFYNKKDLIMRSEEYKYILNNADSICGIVYVPTAQTTYLSKESLKQRHPNLHRQFMELQKEGIDIVDLTLPFQEAAKRERKENPIWWSDDTHWNARGIRIGAKTALKSVDCLQELI